MVAIERPDGVLVERLLEVGVRVMASHPNQVKAARDRFRASGGKSDRFDRFVLCELARTDRHRFRLLEPDSDETKAIRALTRAREDLASARVALANQLRAELERCWPGAIGLFFAIDSPISLAFLACYPSPLDARGLGEKRLAAFLKAHRYTNRKTPAQLLERLRSAPTGRAGEIETRRRRQIVLHLTRTLQVMVEQIGELETEIAEALHAHPDGEIFRSFFHSPASVICAATLLGEIGDRRLRYPHRDAIAAHAGQAPVAVESGKRKNAKFRGKRREVGMDRWAWEHLDPWLELRTHLPVGALFCVLRGPTRGRPCAPAGIRGQLRATAEAAGVRRRFAPHQLRHAHAVEMSREGIPLLVIQRQLGHADLGITAAHLAGSTTPRSSTPSTNDPHP